MAENKPKETTASAPEPKPVFYILPNPGSTIGADGKAYGWNLHEVVEAPEGALDHVGKAKKYSSKSAADKASAALKAKAKKK